MKSNGSNTKIFNVHNGIQSYSEMFYELKNRKEGAFIPFTVAGDPDFETFT